MNNRYKPVLIFFALLYLSTAGNTQGQSRSTVPSINAASRSSDDTADDYASQVGAPGREAMYRASLARIVNQHKQHLQRTDETVSLAVELNRVYGQQRSFTAEQIKKLEHLEKLARRVRTYAGGSDDTNGEISMPVNVGESLDKISKLAQKLQQEVGNTSRRIVSAKIINTSNELIALTKQVRLHFRR